ncbi:ABC-2 type transporter [Rhodopirellula maiorica SM1]|uniref:Transport permease protein n=1 Tax=Rhodopirellula maiorica SM1 TaxID=1265738 RepID=M5REJ4_9BACT|nr:ABC transporter permease [Rhodopirellula maiorica]EMI17883.1 ABC-2 type transporter [Rhodopirellula maiorica SM1]
MKSSPPRPTESLPITVIEAPAGMFTLNLAELWRYRDLLMLLAWRDISARFRQSLVGYGWAVLKPLLSALIYTLIFSVFVRVETDVPYVIFAFSALIPWMYFSASLGGVTGSVVGGGSLLTKVYFPRLVLPFASVVVGLVELLLQLVVVAGLMAWYHYIPGWQLICLPIFVALTVLTALAFGIWLTALNVRYRDVGMAVPFLIQIWMYLCPIVYPITLVPEKWRALYALNPMVGVIEGFRWSLLGTEAPNWQMMTISFAVLTVLLIAGLIYFRKVETTFADII